MSLSLLQFFMYFRVSNKRTKFPFIWHVKKDNLMLLNQFKAFSINLNAQHKNGMTHFDT